MNADATPIIQILKQIPIFADLNENDHAEIVKNVKKEVFPANYQVFKEGDMGDKMYIIRRGEIVVSQDLADGDKVIARLGRDSFFGEMALFSFSPRNATCVTTEETEVFTLSKNDLSNLIKSNRGFASRVKKEYINRDQENKHRERSIGDDNVY